MRGYGDLQEVWNATATLVLFIWQSQTQIDAAAAACSWMCTRSSSQLGTKVKLISIPEAAFKNVSCSCNGT